jgi:Peptidase propeptide and YPEB domain
MNRSVRVAVVVCAVVFAAGIILFAPGQRRVLIAGDKPVTEEQVRAKLETDGYSNVQVSRDGRWFEIRAIKEGKRADLSVNSENGRLADEPFKDADEQD